MKKGISLIVLSITILVMAILAAAVIIALEDSGIIGRSKTAVNNSNYADEYTRLVVIKNGILTDNLGTITVEEYVTELINKGIIESDYVTNADGSVTVTTKTGYEVKLSQTQTTDIIIESEENSNTGENTPTTEYITFTFLDIEYTVVKGTTWYNFIWNGEGRNLDFFSVSSEETTEGYVLYGNGSKVKIESTSTHANYEDKIIEATYVLDNSAFEGQ